MFNEIKRMKITNLPKVGSLDEVITTGLETGRFGASNSDCQPRHNEDDPHYFSFVDNRIISDITCSNLFRQKPSLTYNFSKECETDDGAIQGFDQQDVVNYSIDVPKGDSCESLVTATSFGLNHERRIHQSPAQPVTLNKQRPKMHTLGLNRV